MRIVANENVPGPVVTGLRKAGHDVLYIKESMPGAADRQVIAEARRDRRLVVTFDKGFGELAVRSRLPIEGGVVLLRFRGSSPDADNAQAIEALTSRDDWAGHVAVVTETRVRLRPLPRPH